MRRYSEARERAADFHRDLASIDGFHRQLDALARSTPSSETRLLKRLGYNAMEQACVIVNQLQPTEVTQAASIDNMADETAYE